MCCSSEQLECFVLRIVSKTHKSAVSGERNHGCAQCGKAFKTKRDLGDHTKHVHQDKYPFHCAQCGHGMQQKRYLLKHVCGRVKRRQQQEMAKDPAEVEQMQGGSQKRGTEPSVNLHVAENDGRVTSVDQAHLEGQGHMQIGGTSAAQVTSTRLLKPQDLGLTSANVVAPPPNVSQATPLQIAYPPPRPPHLDSAYFLNSVYPVYNQDPPQHSQLRTFDADTFHH